MLKEVEPAQAERCTPSGLYLFSTAKDGKRNVQFAFRALGVTEGPPPLILVGVGKKNYSHGLIEETKEFVLNVCSQNQLRAINPSRGLSGRTVEDKFQELGLEALPASTVKAPLVAGCYANLECRVVNSMDAADYTLFLAEVVAAHVDEELMPVGRLAGKSYVLQGPVE